MLWIYVTAVAIGYAALFLFRDDASEHIRKWIYPVLIVLGILGGLYFAREGSGDDQCQTYGFRANDCL